jgi:hypothetical protein
MGFSASSSTPATPQAAPPPLQMQKPIKTAFKPGAGGFEFAGPGNSAPNSQNSGTAPVARTPQPFAPIFAGGTKSLLGQ